MIVHHDDAPAPPPCFNQPPAAPFYVRHVLNEATGQVEPLEIRMDWAKPGCASWRGTGIGQPTPEYPTGTPYPIAHGWADWCCVCRHAPIEVKA